IRPARQPGERRREYEGDELVVLGAIAERDGARLVLAHGLQDLAERRVDRAVDDQEADQEDREDDEVDRVGLLEIEHAEQPALRDRLDPVLAARELRLDREEE